jgi:hypothetical protein
MNTLIWFFGISLLLIIIMIIYRSFELKSGKNIISSEKREKMDFGLIKFFQNVETFVEKNLKLLKIKTLDIFHESHVFLHKLWNYIANKVDVYFHRMKGKRQAHKKGAISLYWKSVAEHKDSVKKDLKNN